MVLANLYLSAHRVRFPTVDVVQKVTWKRTVPFNERCGFVFEVASGWFDRCEDDADFGLYFKQSEKSPITMVSLCHYHTILQESYWVGGNE